MANSPLFLRLLLPLSGPQSQVLYTSAFFSTHTHSLPKLMLQFPLYLNFLSIFSGNGDGFFSSEFQSTLVGNDLYDQKVPECELFCC